MIRETEPLGKKLENFGRENDALRVLLGQGLAWFADKIQSENSIPLRQRMNDELIHPDYEAQLARLNGMREALATGFQGLSFNSHAELQGRDRDFVVLSFSPADRVELTPRGGFYYKLEDGPVEFFEIAVSKISRKSGFTRDPAHVVMSGGYRIELRKTTVFVHPKLEDVKFRREIGFALYTNAEGKCVGEGLNYTGVLPFTYSEVLELDKDFQLAPKVQALNVAIGDFKVF